MIRSFLLAVTLVFLCGVAAFAREVPPIALRSFISQYPLFFVGECQVEKLTYSMMPCAVYLDVQRDIRYVVLAQDGKTISHVIALSKDGDPHVLWVRSDLTT